MRIVTVVGARPQFIKAAALSRRRRDARYHGIDEIIVHTGQHYDAGMSAVFFDELEIPLPTVNLQVGPGRQGDQTGAMLSGLERAFDSLRPDLVLVYGDTNSTLAAALVAAKAGIRLAHVEAGLRSFRRAMPEEVNRVVTDRLADLLFCPSPAAARQLAREGRDVGVHVSGDVMYDVFLRERAAAAALDIRAIAGATMGPFVLATIHRAENTDSSARLGTLIAGLGRVATSIPVILPMHPRTRAALDACGLVLPMGIHDVAPVPYRSMLALLCSAAAVVTDSGGLQKEAYFAAVPCVTLRDETEWIETLEAGWNRLAPPTSAGEIAATVEAALSLPRSATPPPLYGDGDAAGRILDVLATA